MSLPDVCLYVCSCVHGTAETLDGVEELPDTQTSQQTDVIETYYRIRRPKRILPGDEVDSKTIYLTLAGQASELFLTVHWPADAYLPHEAAPHALVVVAPFHHLAPHEVDHPLLAQTEGVGSLRAVHVVTCRFSPELQIQTSD